MDSNQGNIIINPFIARRGVEPRKDIIPNIRQSLATLVLSSSNVSLCKIATNYEVYPTELIVICLLSLITS